MEITFKHSDLIHSALDIILGNDSVNLVIRDKNLILFRTESGLKGVVIKSEKNEMQVIVEGNVLYTIENDIYKILNYRSEIPPLEAFIPMLINLYNQNIQLKSKILVAGLLKGISQMITSDLVNVNFDKIFGPIAFIKNSNSKKENIITDTNGWD